MSGRCSMGGMDEREALRRDLARAKLAGTVTLLRYMQQHGQRVTLNWGEDDGLWECSWITGGERFTGWAKQPDEAAVRAATQVQQALDARGRRRAGEGA